MNKNYIPLRRYSTKNAMNEQAHSALNEEKMEWRSVRNF